MVDENKYLKIFNIVKIIGIIAIILAIAFPVYTSLMKKINTDRFFEYLDNENYKLDKYNVYVLEKKDGNTTTTYQALANNYFLSKTIVTIDNNDYSVTKLVLNYSKDNLIEIEMIYEGKNKNGDYAVLSQTGVYKNEKLSDCKVIAGNDFDTKCNVMKENAKVYLQEVKEILNSYNINPKYVKNSSN